MERRRAVILWVLGYVVIVLSLIRAIGTTPTTAETMILLLGVYSAIALWLIERGHNGLGRAIIGVSIFALTFLALTDPSITDYRRTLSIPMVNLLSSLTFAGFVAGWVLMILGGLRLKDYREKIARPGQK